MSARKIRNAYTVYNQARLIAGGAPYFRLMEELIDGAQHIIHLQVYIFDDDETGRRIAAALKRAAARGVAVYVLADGYASQSLRGAFADELAAAGVQFSFFQPLFRSRHFYFGRRLHIKVLVADGRRSLVSGRNISDRYNDINGQQAWLDWALHTEGEAPARLARICERRWNAAIFRPRCSRSTPAPLPAPQTLIRPRVNDWVWRQTQITNCYFELVRSAQQHIIIQSSYFWPSANLLKMIARAAKRGVRVQLLLAGMSDVQTSKYAERYLYSFLFRHGIEVYEYQDNVLHGKMAVCDRRLMTVGSYNVNNISALASIELNMEVKDEAVAQQAHDALTAVINHHCMQMTAAGYARRYNALQRLVHYLAYKLVHLLFFLTTFYFRQEPVATAKKRAR